ncbi:hypothetical protein TWF106_004738 [Orbilia oligospora]|uniref:CAP-Gly domain-containing protein n=1 Tax=Orbilia oligospora TaxID=2813651 RepID=A0A7C8U3Z1_ORBOL|nr:hypothetical protein TWF106_004738 [Orbilia oligospora]
MTTPGTPNAGPRRSLARLRLPSGANTPNPPQISPPMLSPDTVLARKQSLNQLVQNSSSKDSGYGGDSDGGLEIGDKVNVPGGMYGVVKFVGTVKGKPGVFVGVELEGPHAVNGKNDGTVEGTRYFTTSIPHSGIFLPLSRAVLRHSGSSVKSDTPSVVTSPAEPTASSPLQPPKKPFGRPSLPRPQSPAQRNVTPRPGLLPSTPRSGSSLSNRMFSPSPTPGMGPQGPIGGRVRAGSISSNAGDVPPGTPGRRIVSQNPRGLRPGFNSKPSQPSQFQRESTPRASSSMSFTDSSPVEDLMATPKANGNSPSGFVAKLTRMSREEGMSKEEEDKGMIAILQAQLSAKDHQLKEQANNLLEMESSLNELQSLLSDGVAAQQQQQQAQQAQAAQQAAQMNGARGLGRKTSSISINSGDGEEELELAQLRHLLRERNDKIGQLQVDFDAHRADFRSTIDTLEMAATETERVYEKKVEDLLLELRESERLRVEMVEEQNRREEETGMARGIMDGGVESVARQLKSLEGLVAELEEGLEDARRGEAEARAEAEHCRGESERLKEELRREKEKVGAYERRMDDLKEQVKNGDTEVEKKNDEIRGLKALMTSLSRGRAPGGNPEEKKKLEERIKDLEGLLDRKNAREEELEKEIEILKADAAAAAAASAASATSDPPEPLGLKITMPANREEQKSLVGTKDVAGVAKKNGLKARLQDSPALTDIDDDDGEDIINGPGFGGPPPPTSALPPLPTIIASSSPPPPPKKDAPLPATPPPPPAKEQFCDLCEKPGHDLMSCTEMFTGKSSTSGDKKDSVATFSTLEKAGMTPLPLNAAGVNPGRSSLDVEDEGRGGVSLGRATTPSGNAGSSGNVSSAAKDDDDDEGLPPVAGKSSGVMDPKKWCALCERDGHDSVDCPLDDF